MDIAALVLALTAQKSYAHPRQIHCLPNRGEEVNIEKAELKLERTYFDCHEKARGTGMPSLPEQLIPEADNASGMSAWLRRFLVPGITILVWVTLVGIFFWFLGVIATPILLLFLAAVLAYVLYPLVKLLNRFVPRALAILLAYVIVFVALAFVLFFVSIAVLQQVT